MSEQGKPMKVWAVTDASDSLDLGSPPPTVVAYFANKDEAEKVQETIWPYRRNGVREEYVSTPTVFNSANEFLSGAGHNGGQDCQQPH